MDMQFFEHGDKIPQPKQKVRIENMVVTPYPDRRRVFIELEVTPFQERPNLILVVKDQNDRIVGELSVIETMHTNMEFTLHLRTSDDTAGTYTLTTDLFYETKSPPQDRKSEMFVIPEDGGTSGD